jgi:hypothetical protein
MKIYCHMRSECVVSVVLYTCASAVWFGRWVKRAAGNLTRLKKQKVTRGVEISIAREHAGEEW